MDSYINAGYQEAKKAIPALKRALLKFRIFGMLKFGR
jgi:hypothetical protein